MSGAEGRRVRAYEGDFIRDTQRRAGSLPLDGRPGRDLTEGEVTEISHANVASCRKPIEDQRRWVNA